jgi:hypothetical protein
MKAFPFSFLMLGVSKEGRKQGVKVVRNLLLEEQRPEGIDKKNPGLQTSKIGIPLVFTLIKPTLHCQVGSILLNRGMNSRLRV